MEVRPGYKQTEVGIIPEDWEVVALGTICSMKSGEGITSAKIDWFSRYPCYGGNGLRGFTSRFTHDGSYALIGRQGALCGNVLGVEGKFFASEHAVIVTVHPQTDIRWLTYVLGEMHLNRFSESSAQPGLSVSKVLKLGLAFPPTKAEQDAIAKALGDVDALIGALRRLIPKKRDLKQAAMQQLLTGQTRLPGFSGEWEVKRFSDLFQFLSTANNPRADLSAFGDVAYIHYGDIHTTNSAFLNCSQASLPLIAKELVAGIPFVEEGDIVMADASEDYAGIGKCVEVHNVQGRKIVAGLHTFLLRGNKELLADGFKGYLQFIPSVKAALIRFATGISVYGVSKNSVRSVEVRLPRLAEQTAIAAVLSDMDAELAALEQRLAKTRALKQGMMQELLTGRTRLV